MQAANILMTWEEVVSIIPSASNHVWKSFCLSRQDAMRKGLVQKGIKPTEEEIEKHMRLFLVEEEHPVRTYLKVYKCSKCPEFHIAEIDCLIIHAETLTDEEAQKTREDYMFFKNVTLAFPVPLEGDTWMYSVHSGINQLAVLVNSDDANKDNNSLVYIDPAFIDIVLAMSAQTH